jgi:DNA-binding transcriptional MerR regulator
MRVAELSRGSGVPVPTIKYYLREGLLPAGERTSPNQVQYGDEHLRRLRLIRALTDVGGLSIGQVRDVLTAIDSPDGDLHKLLGMVQEGITVSREATDDEAWRTASQDVDEMITRQGWQCSSEGPAGRALTAVLVSLRELGHPEASSLFETYVRACEEIATADVGYMADFANVENMIERMVVGTVLGDAALVAIRRLAHENASAIRYAEQGKSS